MINKGSGGVLGTCGRARELFARLAHPGRPCFADLTIWARKHTAVRHRIVVGLVRGAAMRGGRDYRQFYGFPRQPSRNTPRNS